MKVLENCGRKILAFTAMTLAASAQIAYADVVWPAVYIAFGFTSAWSIVIGLTAEYFIIWRAFALNAKIAAKAVVVANAVSLILGFILIPLAGIIYLFELSLIQIPVFSAFGWVSVLGSFVIACLINSLVEGFIYKRVFTFDFQFRSRKFLWIVAANAASVGVVAVQLAIQLGLPWGL